MQEFFRGGFQADPGEAGGGLQEIFQIPGRAQPQFLVASMVKMEELSGQGAIALQYPMAYASDSSSELTHDEQHEYRLVKRFTCYSVPLI